ncbi:hypothetical protein V4Y02_24265, partial [Escherichia coli]
ALYQNAINSDNAFALLMPAETHDRGVQAARAALSAVWCPSSHAGCAWLDARRGLKRVELKLNAEAVEALNELAESR